MNPARLVPSALLTLALATPTVGTSRADEPTPPNAPTSVPTVTSHDEHALNLGLFVGADYLTSLNANGGALSAGLRLGVFRHFAASLDIGYGLLTAFHSIDDRWWAIPSVAFVLPVGPGTLDLGGGVGFGTVSGYVSSSEYFARPFTPTWHITAAAVRAHAVFAFPITSRFDLFGRAEVATLLSGTPPAGTDAFWVGLSFGFQVRLF